MKNRYRLLLFFFFLPGPGLLYPQVSRLDSLQHILKLSKGDSIQVNALNELFLEYEFANPEKAGESLNEALKLSEKLGYKKGQAATHLYLGYFSEDRGNYEEALKQYAASLKISEAMEDKKGQADAYGNIGNIYVGQGNYPEALKKYLKALKIKEANKDLKGQANSYNNIGTVYSYQGNHAEALKSYLKCLKIYETLEDKSGVANCYSNIGNVYYAQRNFPDALKNYFTALKIRQIIGDKKGEAASHNNIGVVYADQGSYEEALKNHEASLEIKELLGDKRGIATSYNNLGLVQYAQAEKEKDPGVANVKLNGALKNYAASLKIKEQIGDKAGIAGSDYNIGNVLIRQKQYAEAEKYLIKARDLSKEIGYKDMLKSSFGGLTVIDSARGNYRGAYENHKLYVLYRDSLDNEETRKKTIQNQMTYDFEKKEAVAEAEHKKEMENQELIAGEKSRKQRLILLLVSFFLLVVVIFAGFIFRTLRVTKKQKDIIEEQKSLVELQKSEVELQKIKVDEHQKAIIDSITYARRIQRSLLPTDKYIEKNLERLNPGKK